MKRALRSALLLSLFTLHGSLFVSAEPQTPKPALSELVSYEVGDPLAPQLTFEKHLRAATSAERTAIEIELIALIAAPDTTTAAKIVFFHWLGWIGTEKSIPALNIVAKNPDLAHAAISALAAINTSEANDLLVALIENHDTLSEATRIEALNALGQRRANTAVAAIAKLTDDKNSAIASAALEALGNIGTPDAIKALRAFSFSDAQEIPRARALLTATGNLLRRNPSAKNRKLAIDIHAATLRAATTLTVQVETAQALVSLDPVNQALFEFPMDCDPRLRAVIGCGMATSGNTDAIDLITDNYAAIPADTVCRMLSALATKPAANALPLIDLALASQNNDLQLAAIAAAGACRNETTVAKLIPLLGSENNDLSAAAFTALTQLPDCDGKTNAALRGASVSDKVAPQILRALATRQDRDSFAAAVTETASSDKTLRAAAYEAVALLVRPGDLPAILSLDAAPNRREWTKALYASAATHPDAAGAAGLIQKQLAAAKPADRPTLIAALTMVESDTAKTALDAMLTSPDIDVRKETIRALSSARTETAFELLLARINAATDSSERLLAQRGAIDTIDQLTLPANDKIDAYRKLWKTAGTQEPKDAIIAAVKRMRGSAAARFLKEITAQK